MQISIEEYIQNMSEKAVEYASSFNKTFSFLENDINELEEILDYYSNDLKGNFFNRSIKKFNRTTPTEDQIYSMSIIWGSYLGEVLRRNTKFKLRWVKEDVFGDGEIVHIIAGETRIFPIDKVYKRLVNGKEDSIVSFYDIIKSDLL